jgi:GTPase
MKILVKLILGLSACLIISCKSSGVTLEQLQKQEAEAREGLAEVQVELKDLASMKEQYSVDNKKALLAQMRDRLDDIDGEIAKLKSVTDSENSAVSGAAKKGLDSLKKEEQMLRKKIEEVEALPKENWATSLETINQSIATLETEVNKIMQNVDADSVK